MRKKRSCSTSPPINCMNSYCDKDSHTWICTSCIDGYNTPESNCTNSNDNGGGGDDDGGDDDNTDLTFRRNRSPYMKNRFNSRMPLANIHRYMRRYNNNNIALGAYADYINNNSNYSYY